MISFEPRKQGYQPTTAPTTLPPSVSPAHKPASVAMTNANTKLILELLERIDYLEYRVSQLESKEKSK